MTSQVGSEQGENVLKKLKLKFEDLHCPEELSMLHETLPTFSRKAWNHQFP